ncbi:hypothetical protein FSARC_5160 [Fusarium sarcochroum]|uniref:Uncharacterized protein n=1 Tax=Fusarium sarcochroum TaxID=1208366 RepID=A0A8H4X9T4_9HYPO|nr:hypothetical protein FSARC_5160 [Fusarium sarcochroum]
MGSSCSTESGDPYWWGYLDDGKGWTARPKSQYMSDPSYNKKLRRQQKRPQQYNQSMSSPGYYGMQNAPAPHGYNNQNYNNQGWNAPPPQQWNGPQNKDQGWSHRGVNDDAPPPAYQDTKNPFLSSGHQRDRAQHDSKPWN